ncbi:MAG: hypothetical protein WCK37_02110 [Candidatus Falkowbacteria bacterium]
MNRKVIASTGANEDGDLLWCVHFASSYYDDDGIVPVDERFFVLAKSSDEAKGKVKKDITKAEKRCDKGHEKKIEAVIVTLESLIAARDSSGDGRLGWHSNKALTGISLSCEDDRKKYRLQVCLVPVN